jgi:ATP phosphoribosyltransferase
MYDDKLVIGMPAGSLADPNRGGNLITLLRNAGFPTKGYDSGGPTSFPLHGVLVGWDGRPQEFGSQLALGQLDIAIGGSDWVRERVLEFRYEYGQDVVLEQVLSLERGHVRIVIIHNDCESGRSSDEWMRALLSSKPLVSMVSEMPYLALDWFQKKAQSLGFGDSHKGFSVQKYQTPPKIDSGIVIYETWGKTEAKVKNGAVDFGLEITQTGSAIRNYGLVIAEEVMCSETGIWINPGLKSNTQKTELARMFLLNLYGSVFAENKVILTFNGKKDDAPRILDYLQKNKLFADEPTMNEGANFTEFSIQLDASSRQLPLARVRYELAKLGATGIETIPLDSSIPGIDAISF